MHHSESDCWVCMIVISQCMCLGGFILALMKKRCRIILQRLPVSDWISSYIMMAGSVIVMAGILVIKKRVTTMTA